MDKLPGISKGELQRYIKQALNPIRLWSQSAENLLLGTCAQESLMGRYVAQMDGGPARGLFQMEEVTFQDIIKHSDTLRRLKLTVPQNVDMLIYDINAAIIFARLKYTMVKEMLPEADNVVALATYWKKYYNTELGKGTIQEFVQHYKYYIGD